MSEHAKLPPSSASRRVVCPGSRRLEELYPQDKESPHAREGQAAHEVASAVLKNFLKLKSNTQFFGMVKETGTGELITSEMWDGAKLYADHILTTAIRLFGIEADIINHAHIERPVDISNIHPDCWGTPDCWLYVPGQLHIWDYKFGHGLVEVFENWQLIEYAAGVFKTLQFNGITDQQTRVYFHIVQPRGFHPQGPIRTWEINGAYLRGYFNQLIEAERKAAENNAVCIPSPECTYCTARHVCAALQNAALTSVNVAYMNSPVELPAAALGSELRQLRRAAALLDARITGLSEQALNSLRKGHTVPHFKLEQSMGRDRWKKEAAEVVIMGQLYGVDLSKPVETVTPRQAIKAGMPENVVNTLIVKTPGPMKLVEDNGSDARKIFGSDK